MNIITGRYRGARIVSSARVARPNSAGRNAGFRPTTGIVRESIFSVLENVLDFAGIKVLDLYAGTGALGFEALSRGAEFATFVEQSKELAQCIRETARGIGIYGELCEVFGTKVEVFCKKAGAINRGVGTEAVGEGRKFRYDLIFSDAPYKIGDRQEQIAKLIFGAGIVEKRAWWVWECSSDCDVIEEFKFEGVTVKLVKSKKFGGSSFYVYECEES